MEKKHRLLSRCMTVLSFALVTVLAFGESAQAATNEKCLAFLNAGVESVLDMSSGRYSELIEETAKTLQVDLDENSAFDLVMANVKGALNVRSEASEEASKVGKLYRDCGGTILERKDGWTKIRSGNLEGWANDNYLLFGFEARELANDVGRMVATVGSDALRVREEPGTDSKVLGMLPPGELVDVVSNELDGWVMIDYDGQDGYVSADYVTVDFQIDYGETLEEIKAREAAEREAKRHVNYGAYTTDADTTLLLAALVQCEAGGEEYEGQVAVAAVVMNRVRSGAYPDSIHGVIYASGQFTPALNGRVNKVYESGKIKSSCIQAAEEAISGVSNVGGATHFRRNNGRDGIVIGNHVFY